MTGVLPAARERVLGAWGAALALAAHQGGADTLFISAGIFPRPVVDFELFSPNDANCNSAWSPAI